MELQKAKLFIKENNHEEIIESIFYDDNVGYYTFINQCKIKGYKQVIVTTEIMLQILREFVAKKGFSIYNIEFSEEDYELDNEIKSLPKNIKTNQAHFTDLLDKIKFLSEQCSIHIKRVYLKGKYNGKFTPNFYIQSNGIFGVNIEFFDQLSKDICTLIEKYLIK